MLIVIHMSLCILLNCTYLQISNAVIDATSVQFVMLDTFEKVSLKITYEFSTFTSDQLVELINYEQRLTTVGRFNVSTGPQLTVFESTGMYIQCSHNLCIFFVNSWVSCVWLYGHQPIMLLMFTNVLCSGAVLKICSCSKVEEYHGQTL